MNAELITESETRVWPEKVTVDWRRFSCGLWRVPEGDISEAYSASSMPKVTVFTHEGCLFTNGGSCSSQAVMCSVDAYPLMAPANYHGLESVPYSYEGRTVQYRGKDFRLGPKVIFTSTDLSVEEWRHLFRVLYADGGYFARQASYGLFLSDDLRNAQSPNGQVALNLELAGELLGLSKDDMKRFLEGGVKTELKLQLDFAL